MKSLLPFAPSRLLLCTILNSNGVVLWSNKTFNSFFQNSKAKHLLSIIHPDEEFKIKRLCLRCVDAPGKLFYIQVKTLQVGNVYSLFAAEVFFKENAFHIFAVKVYKSENPLPIENEEYKDKLREISHDVSHNLRAPLVRILALNDLILITEDKAEIQKLSSFMSQSAEELDKVLHDITSKAYFE